jgi:hypothetical protein
VASAFPSHMPRRACPPQCQLSCPVPAVVPSASCRPQCQLVDALSRVRRSFASAGPSSSHAWARTSSSSTAR